MSGDAGCKVEVVTDGYGLAPPGGRYASLDDYLLARWTGASGREPVGYRTLAEEFNRRLLKRVYDDHDRPAFDARVEADYATLTGDDSLGRGELADDLAADGIDAERLRRDLVSWGTMATHLKDCLGGEKAAPTAETDWERRSIDIATDRARAKVAEAVSSLAGKGELPDGADEEVALQVQLGCPSCHTRVPLSIALERGYVCETHRA
ncbi:MAG: hypothetical protein U5J98_00490 [Halobacteriales archaeon]|nr:hypothetical protein [Halobacteriales archaeon]